MIEILGKKGTVHFELARSFGLIDGNNLPASSHTEYNTKTAKKKRSVKKEVLIECDSLAAGIESCSPHHILTKKKG